MSHDWNSMPVRLLNVHGASFQLYEGLFYEGVDFFCRRGLV